MLTLLTAVQAAALLHSTMVSSQPLVTADTATGPRPQEGVWALLPTDCAPPTTLDLASWPKCATPIGFVDDEVAALERPGPGKRASADAFYSIARTKFAMAPGAPVVASASPALTTMAPTTMAPTPPAPTPQNSTPAAPSDSTASTPADPAPTPSAPSPLTPTAPMETAVAQVVVPMVFSRSYYYLAIVPDSLDPDRRFAAAQGWPVACLPREQGGCTAQTLASVQAQAAIPPADPTRLYRLVRIRPADTATPPAAPSQ